METTAEEQTPATLARSAIRYLAERRIPPTPENYASAWRAVGGVAPDPQLPARVAGELLTRLSERGGIEHDSATRLRAALRERRWRDADSILSGSVSVSESVHWGELIGALIEGLEHSHRGWTSARKRQGVRRVLAAQSDMKRLYLRLSVLVESWQREAEDAPVIVDGPLVSDVDMPAAGTAPRSEPMPGSEAMVGSEATAGFEAMAGPEAMPGSEATAGFEAMAGPEAMPGSEATAGFEAIAASEAPQASEATPGSVTMPEPEAAPSSDALSPPEAAAASGAPAERNAPPGVEESAPGCPDCERSRYELDLAERAVAEADRTLDEMQRLISALCDSFGTLSEDGSWIRGQLDAVREMLRNRVNRFELASARMLLEQTGAEQRAIADRRRAGLRLLKETLTALVARIGGLGDSTNGYAERIGDYASAIEQADSLDGLADTVRSLLGDTRALRTEVESSRREFLEAQERARSLEQEVSKLEFELAEASDRMLKDHLTQTLNRRGLEQAFEQAQQRVRMFGEVLALALIDVDNFKRLNDRFGHQTGDRALVHLASMLQSRLRPGDTVARYGGEEFALLLPRNDPETARTVIGRLQRELTKQVFLHETDQVFITFSAGVTSVSRDEAMDGPLRRADAALYRAKRNGKNRVEIEDAPDERDERGS